MRYLFAACVSALMSTAVVAQWSWKDANGSTVFSDRPPPAEVKSSQILREPRGAGSVSVSADSSVSPPAAAAGDPPKAKTTAELEADFRKRQIERAESEKKSAEDAQRKQQAVESCSRARDYLRVLDEGRRIRLPNGDVVDDAQREAERQRTNELIAQSCR